MTSATEQSRTVVDVFRSQDGRVFVNVNRDGVDLAHLRVGEQFVIPPTKNAAPQAQCQEPSLATSNGPAVAASLSETAPLVGFSPRGGIEASPLSASAAKPYDLMADAVCEIADAARQAFIKAGFDPGEWDSDNIVQDVKRGIVDAIETLAARSSSAEPVAWMIRYKGCASGPVETVFETALQKARDTVQGADVVPLYFAPVSATGDMERDAKRYRWWREHARNLPDFDWHFEHVDPRPEQVDAIIDGAMDRRKRCDLTSRT